MLTGIRAVKNLFEPNKNKDALDKGRNLIHLLTLTMIRLKKLCLEKGKKKKSNKKYGGWKWPNFRDFKRNKFDNLPKNMQDKKSQNLVKTGSLEVIKRDNIAVSRSLPDGSAIEIIKPTLRLIAIHNISQKMGFWLTPLN